MCSAQTNIILLASHGAVRCAQHGMVRDQTRSVHTDTEIGSKARGSLWAHEVLGLGCGED